MREFLKDKIFDLYLYCGNRQENKMTNEEIEKLLDVLERVCKVYDYIPEEKQKEIIEAQLLRDKEYQNINARLISKWLEENGKHFFTQQHHAESLKVGVPNYKPLEGEERDKAIQTYLDALARVQLNFSGGEEQKGNGARMREQLDEAGVKFDEEKHKEETIVRKESSSLDDFVNKVGDYAEQKSLEGNNTDETEN